MLALMDKVGFAALATIFAGALVALQAPINAVLGDAVGTIQAATVNFGVGFAILVVLSALAGGGIAQIADVGEVPWYYAVGGGMVGAAYVATVVVTVPTLGAAGITAATVGGQLAASLVADRLGILGLAERAITPARVAGIVLLMAGVYLVIRE